MAINWDLYNKRLNINGLTNRDRQLNSLQNNISKYLPDSLSYKAVKIDSVDRQLNITETSEGYDIQSLPNETFNVGDYVIYKTSTYLITSKKGDEEVYAKGHMKECNFTLHFQSPDGTILSYPCITSGKSYSNDESKVITLPSNQKSILLSYDENTKLLDTDKRLFVDKDNKKPYKIIGSPDNTTYNYGNKGLIYFVVEQDELQDDDRQDLGVCDYFEPNVEPEPPVVGYNYAIISTSGDLVIGGSTRTITPTFYNADGTLSTESITPVWIVILPSGYESDFTVTYAENQIKITVAEDYDLIDKNVVVNVQGNNGGYGGTNTFLISVE